MLWTTLAFLLLTGLFVWAHFRRSAARGEAVRPEMRCPRCDVVVPEGRRTCPSCGAPPQVFEVVAAPIASPGDAEPRPGARMHAVVRADMCVGCGTCVAACPEPGALQLWNKLAVVNPSACVAHGQCVSACPVGAIFLSTGAAVQRVEVPHVSIDFESNVPGIFIVGELGGRGLIKNAINEGKFAVGAVAQRLRSAAASGNALLHDVVIVGSGPAGLSAGLEAARQGLRYVILEQGSPAESIRRYPRHKILLAEPVNLPLYGDLWIGDSSKEKLLEAWERIIAVTGLEIRCGQRVTGVVRSAWGFQVETAGASYPARYVVLAMGRRGTPRKLEVPGEELPKVFYDIVETDAFRGRRVLVVGGGDSAIESALGLAQQPGTEVTLSHRGSDFPRLKERNRTKLDEAVARSRVRLLLDSRVTEILADAVLLDAPGGPLRIPNDDVVVRVGGEPPTAFLDKIGVQRVVKELAIGGGSAAAR